jgi:hypothetical protein
MSRPTLSWRFVAVVVGLLMCAPVSACGGGSGAAGGGLASATGTRSRSAVAPSASAAPDRSSTAVAPTRSAAIHPTNSAEPNESSTAEPEPNDSGAAMASQTPKTRTTTATATATATAAISVQVSVAPTPTTSAAAAADSGTNSRWLWVLLVLVLVAAAVAAWLRARSRSGGQWRQQRDSVYRRVTDLDRDDVPRVATRSSWEQANSAWQEMWPRLDALDRDLAALAGIAPGPEADGVSSVRDALVDLRTALTSDLDLRRGDGPGQDFLVEDSARALSAARAALRAAVESARSPAS